jgi:hypothetical protein
MESAARKNIAATTARIEIITEVTMVSFFVGQLTFRISIWTCLMNIKGLVFAIASSSVFYLPMAGVEGLEPTTFGFGDRRSAS